MFEPEMTLLERAYFNSFIDFLCRMIEKYADTIDWSELKERSMDDAKL